MTLIRLISPVLSLCLAPVALSAGDTAHPRVMVSEVAPSRARNGGKLSIRTDGEVSYKVRMGGRSGDFSILLYNAYLKPGLHRAFKLMHGRSPTLVRISQVGPSVVKISIRTDAEIICDEWLTEDESSSITIQAGKSIYCNIFSPGYVAAAPPSDRPRKPPPAAPEIVPGAHGSTRDAIVQFSAQAANDTAYAVKQPTGFTKTQNSLSLAGAGRLTQSVSYRISGRFYYDPVYDLSNRYSTQVARDQRDSAELRDAYVDISAGNADIRAGRQQIVWGEAVGTHIADIVNPLDMREFILQDFDLARIPQWSLDAEYTLGDLHLEGVWVPFPEFDRLGAPGSQFVFAAPVPSGAIPVLGGERVPGSTFRNGEYGARISRLVSGWDLTLFGMRAWDKFPSYPRTVTATPFGSIYAFTPEHKRLSISGATFTKEAWDYVFKGEAAYTNRKALSLMNASDPSGVVFRDTLDAMLGADHTFFKNVDANAQIIHRRVFGYFPGIFQESRTATFASLWVKTGFFNGKLEPELMVMSGLNVSGEHMVRPKVTLRSGENVEFEAGLDMLYGNAAGLFGQFAGSSRVYLKTRYTF